MGGEQITVVRAGRLVDVAAGEARSRQAIVVRGDRIAEVRPDDGTVPEGAREVDLSTHTVLPGLIDCHAHMVGEVESGHGYAGLVTRTGAHEAMSGVRNARTTPTMWVFVIAIGVESVPDSRTHSRPVSSPFPFSR